MIEQIIDLSGDLTLLKCVSCGAPLAFPEPVIDLAGLNIAVAGDGVMFKPEQKKLIVGILRGSTKVGKVEQRSTCASCGSNYVGERPITSLMAVGLFSKAGWKVLVGETIG